MTQPKVSVIIPVYNTEKYLRECLDSVINQTLTDIEIICVDDASTDSSPEILAEYAAADSRITVITHEVNKKQAAVKKTAVARATGKYIWFVDSDDTISLNGCEKAFELAQKQKVDILHFNMDIVNAGNLDEAMITDARDYAKPFNGKLDGTKVFTGCFEKKLYGFTLVSKLFEAKLCKKVFASAEELPITIAEDEYLFFMLSYYAKSYFGTPDLFLYKYRFGIGVSARKVVSLQMHTTFCEAVYAVDAMGRFLEQWGEKERYKKTLKNIRYQLFRNCVAEWQFRCRYEDKAIEYHNMLRYWLPEEIIPEIARLNWENRNHIAKLINSKLYFNRPTKKVKKIGVYYPHITIGGAQRVVVDLINLWQSMGYECVLITDFTPDKNDYDLPSGIKRVVIPSYMALNPDNYQHRAKAWANLIRNNNIDTVVYHNWVAPCLLWDTMMIKALGASFIAHCHGIFTFLLLKNDRYWGETPAIFSLADAVVCIGKADKHFWGQFNPNTHFVVNPKSCNVSENDISDLKSKTVIWVARFSPEKRPEDCVEIAALVAKEIPDVKFYMVGDSEEDGSYLGRIKRRAKDLGVYKNFVFTGFQTNVKPYYLDSSVFLMTSMFEGFSLTLAEAKSFGLPCVMYELPYLLLTENNRGILPVKMGDTAAAANALIKLLNDESLRQDLGQQSLKHVQEIGSFDYVANWQKIFDSLSEESKQAIDPAAKTMWNTLIDHYNIGIKAAEQEKYTLQLQLDELKKGRSIVEMPPVTTDLTERDREIQFLRTEIAAIHSSWTYRLGSILTFIPRGIRRVINCKKEHSWGYTLARIKCRIPDLFKGWRF